MSADPLTVAQGLVAAGEVVLTAQPNPTYDPAVTDAKDPRGKEFWLPSRWQHATNHRDMIRGWRPGWALLLVTSRRLAAVDVDTKHGADPAAEVARLSALGVPILGMAVTPSGGAHIYVPAVGLASTNNPGRGIDTRGRAPDGTGTGFVYLPGTQRPKYAGGGYVWVTVPDPAAADDCHPDVTHDALAAYLVAVGSTPRTRSPELATPVEGEPLPDMPPILRAMLADIGPSWDFADGRKDDRSRRFYRLVGECHREGLTHGETVTALDPWCQGVGKYTNRVAAEVARAWKRITADAGGDR